MKPEDDQHVEVPLRWPLRDVIDALTRLETAATRAGSALSRAGGAAPSEEWPDVVLEDILDAEYINEE